MERLDLCMAYSPYAEHSLAVLRSNGSFTTLAQMPGLLYCVKSDLILCFPGWSQGVFLFVLTQVDGSGGIPWP